MKLRVAAVQLNSVLGNVEENMNKVIKMLEQAFPKTVTFKPDLIVLPELALTGYNFKSPNHINPFLEIKGTGKSFEFGKLISQHWDCMTLLGYPEKFIETENIKDSNNNNNNNFKIYNSAILIDSKGKIIHNYRKSHLFETDKIWGCSESPDGFTAFNLPFQGNEIRTTIGICMDLNPYEFKAPFENFEFGNFAHKEKCKLILVPTAWMNSNWNEFWKPEEITGFKNVYKFSNKIYEMNLRHDKYKDNAIFFTSKETKLSKDYKLDKVDGSTGKYWVIRMNPIFSNEHPEYKQCVVICNRSGMEDNLMYAGTSSIYTFHGGKMQQTDEGISIDFTVEGSLGQGTEGILYRELEI
ncbi:Carbon-nitrogen hydrolase [Pichia californica]|uniref:Carbon-nitrogen hydrolase n=1 Tax=Pichia californica TaxID=460514 RepID=A0A9P6WJC9_9ASCO|nr:Carbon-nitrogen hydrolase [[Candida] californica]KAG0687187.1 Carbon-nitrogen hydrolase [[Candida] californica]